MPNPNATNPKTGLRYGFEEEQRRKKAESPEAIHKQIALLKRQKAALEARDRLMPFIKFTMPDPEDPNDIERSVYENARHHDAIARAMEEVEKGNFQFLIITTQPRGGKSEIVSRRFPAWFMGRHPDWNVVVATYNDDFAMDFGKDVRGIMATPQYKQVFPEVRLQKGGAAANRLQTTKGGMATFVGRGGSLTGRGAHCLVLDDIISNFEQANSQTIRNQTWEWFTKVAMTRRMGPKLVVITFTRWHNDDIIGRLTDPENPHYNETLARKIKIINLPAIAGDDDPLGRAPGEALWPERYGLEFLEEQRALDPLGFEALYQQRPSLLDGDDFKRENIKFYDQLPENLRFYAASDHAVGVKQRNDPSCFIKIGIDENDDIYVTDVIWRRMKPDVAVEAMLAMCRGNSAPVRWWAERGHISQSIGPFLRKRMLETGTYINIAEVTPVADKAQRAGSIIGRVAMGKVYFPRNASWTEKAINEMMAFPNGTHDDFVDALAYIGLGLQSQFRPGKGKAAEQAKKRPEFGTLAWVKLQDKWAAEQRAQRAAGGF